MIADIGLVVARRAGAPLLVVTQDVFPEIAVELRRLENPALVKLLGFLVSTYLRRADQVIAIGETMAERLEAKGVPPERLDVIPNWVNAAALRPPPADNPWVAEHDLADKFIVMHSGNVGHAQNLELLVRAVSFLRDLSDLEVVIIGSGARHRELEQLVSRLETANVRFLPYEPTDRLSQSLGSGSVHYVGLAPRLAGYVVPSRLYGVLAVGRPVLVAADAASETARIVEQARCGLVVAPDRPDALAAAIRRFYSGEFDLEAMGARGREYVLHAVDREVAIGRYRDVLTRLS
jgi:glycosyltransferase involved in cell wall biosynthesis